MEVAVTLAENVHDAPDASEADARVTELAPALAVIVPPPQLPVSPLGVATTTPLGRLSVKLIPVNVEAVSGFAIMKVRETFPPTTTLDAPNDALIDGGE
jgi:hypothetical protein